MAAQKTAPKKKVFPKSQPRGRAKRIRQAGKQPTPGAPQRKSRPTTPRRTSKQRVITTRTNPRP